MVILGRFNLLRGNNYFRLIPITNCLVANLNPHSFCVATSGDFHVPGYDKCNDFPKANSHHCVLCPRFNGLMGGWYIRYFRMSVKSNCP
jgi:hypothetical protein